jgi:N-acetylmuramoyl-L-alanine amidase
VSGCRGNRGRKGVRQHARLALGLIAVGAVAALPWAPALAQATAGAGWEAKVAVDVAPPQRAGNRVRSLTVKSIGRSGAATARTVVTLELAAATPFTVFRLPTPERVVIDMGEVDFQLPAEAGRQGEGLVQAYRFGLLAPGKSRVVMDTTGPIRIDAARIVEGAKDAPLRLEIELVAATEADVAAVELATAAQAVGVKPEEKPGSKVEETTEKPKPPRSKPVIVIDPGHGGIDSGAEGKLGLEKNVVLAVAREVRRALVATRRYDVIMTRTTDVFIPLDQRVRIARQAHADLFISLHADSLPEKDRAQAIRGATVYTLGERASDERSRVRAEIENRSDLLAGIAQTDASADDNVRDILVDLMWRESANLATDFRNLLIARMRSRVSLAREPMRQAPFKVLRQPSSPAVLLELGYISNAQDEKLMSSQVWQRGVAEAVSQAVDEYFRKTPARAN